REARYGEAMQAFLAAQGEHAAIAKRVVAGYLSYAFHRAGEVTETIDGIDRIMGTGFNWAPPSVLVDALTPAGAIALIEGAGLPVPAALRAVKSRLFRHATINPGRFFVAS
ncbi:MAG TPA: hypothetical protein VFT98_07525, partial [Myxococcota bacterium]|nr:hypothetical protein [Myxococcota bacterium]